MDIRRISAIKNGDEVMGSRTRVKVVKNKMAPPFREVEFDILFGEGISREGDLLDLACQYGVVEKSGSWFAFNGEKLGQGRDNTRQFLKEHPEFVDKIRNLVEAKAVKEGGLVLSSQASAEETRGAEIEKSESKDKPTGRVPTTPAGIRGNSKKSD
jgi:recombination protein RecA